MHRLVPLLFGVLLGLAPCVQADDTVPYRSFSEFDGLPSERITALAQTNDGLLWIGTDTGLATYDGHDFRQVALPDSIGTVYVSAIRALPDGSVWVAASRGEVVKVRPTGVVRVVDVDGQFVWQILRRPDAALFVTSNTVWRMGDGGAATAQSFRYVGEAAGTDRGAIGAGLGPEGRLWIVHPQFGPGRVRPDGTVSFVGARQGTVGAEWAEIAFAEDGTAVALRGETLYRLNPETGTITPLADALGTPTYLTMQGTMVYVTRNQSLLRRNVATNQWRAPLTPRLGLPETVPAAVLRGQEGGLWVGTHDGLLYLQAPGARLTGTADGAPVKDVMQFLAHDEAVWARTYGSGLVRMPPNARRVRPGELGEWRAIASQNQALHALAADTKDWYRWREGTGWQRVRAVEGSPAGLVEPRGFVAPDGTGLFRHEEGLFRYPPRPDAAPTPVVTWPDSLSYRHDVAPAPNGDILHRAKARLYRRRPDGTIRDTLGTIPDNSRPGDEGLAIDPYSNLRHMAMDGAGRVWGAFTYDGGLLRIDPSTGTQTTLLDEQRVWRADVAGDSLVMASTRQHGLYLIDAQSATIQRRLTRSDGLKSSATMAAHLTPDTLYVGHPNGITRLPADGLLDAPRTPDVLLNGLEVGFDERPLAVDSVEAADRSIGFSYAGVSLKHPERVQHEVRLVPHDTAWKATDRRFAQYTNLAPGTYRFEVRARLAGQPPGPPATHFLTIPPRFYETNWFRLLVVLGFLGLCAGAYRWRVHRLRQRKTALRAAVEERTRQLQARTDELAAEKEKTEAQAERLAELDEAKNRFFAHISHEFRTPLSLILSPLQDALQRATADSVTFGVRQVQRMTRNAERLGRLIDQLLDLATLEAGEMSLEYRPGDLAREVRRAAEAFRSRAEQKEITLRVDSPSGRVAARFDPEKIETVVSNLVGNAVKFTPTGGQITVRMATMDTTEAVEGPDDGAPVRGTAQIEVVDTGPGIAPSVQEQIFDRFEQADNSTTRDHEGTGLGLALTRELVELHGGTIDVDSTPGKGSRFTVRLPLVPVAEPDGDVKREGDRKEGERKGMGDGERRSMGDGVPAAPTEKATEAVEGAARPSEDVATVLVVEDNAEMRAYLREELAQRWQVVEAENGEAGWAAVREEAPDLVVSDVMMPGLSGTELCRRIKAEERLRAIPVLLLTARAGEEATLEGLQAGADDYVEKPFGPETLRRRIENHLAARRHLQARYREEVSVEALGVVVKSEERPFVEQVMETASGELANPDFGVGDLAEAMAMSRRQLTRRLKRAIDEPPGQVLRRLRIERGKRLLREGAETVSEVAYATGFRSPSAFSHAFGEVVGVTPTEYVEEATEDTVRRRKKGDE